jgi:hypothetical protein
MMPCQDNAVALTTIVTALPSRRGHPESSNRDVGRLAKINPDSLKR